MNNYDAIPSELRTYKNWILWKYVPVENKKPTKVPYQINGYKADVTDAANWSSFDDCFNALSLGSYDGLGFVFTDTPYSGIDLDDPNGDDLVLQRQIKIYQEFDSYSELSPSGKGLHIIVKGNVPSGRRKSSIEVYSTARYFTVTGNIYNGNAIIAERQQLLSLLFDQMGEPIQVFPTQPDKPQEISDEEIIKRATEAVNGYKFLKLYKGEWQEFYPHIVAAGQGPSEADFALIDIIAFYTQNREQVFRIFCLSVLGKRDKYVKRKDLVHNMITRSFDNQIPSVDIDGLNKEYEEKKLRSLAQLVEPIAQSAIVNSQTTIYNDLPEGLLGEIASFIYNAAPKPVKEIALAGAIGLMSGICGKAYNTYTNTGLNQYVLLLAPTGTGKEAMASGISKLIAKAKEQVPVANDFIGPSSIASGPGLHKFLSKNSQCFLSILGEFGIKLETMYGVKSSSAQSQLKDVFLHLYNKSGYTDVYGSSAYSDQEKNSIAISAPSFSILAESTPESVYEILNEKMIVDGFLPRFSIIEYDGIRVPSNDNPCEPSDKLIRNLCDLMNHAKKLMGTNRTVIVYPDEAALIKLREIDIHCDNKINSANASHNRVISNLWSRARVKVLKLSAMLAVGINPYNPIVKCENVNWAWDMVQYDVKALSAKFETGQIGINREQSKQAEEMIRILKEYVDKDFLYVSKYGAKEILHKNKVMSNTYLSLRLKKLAPFRNDKLGETVALKRCIQSFIENGVLINHDISKYELVGTAWKINVSGLNDMAFHTPSN